MKEENLGKQGREIFLPDNQVVVGEMMKIDKWFAI